MYDLNRTLWHIKQPLLIVGNCGDFCNKIFSFWPKFFKKPTNFLHNILFKNIFSKWKKQLPKKNHYVPCFYKSFNFFWQFSMKINKKSLVLYKVIWPISIFFFVLLLLFFFPPFVLCVCRLINVCGNHIKFIFFQLLCFFSPSLMFLLFHSCFPNSPLLLVLHFCFILVHSYSLALAIVLHFHVHVHFTKGILQNKTIAHKNEKSLADCNS